MANTPLQGKRDKLYRLMREIKKEIIELKKSVEWGRRNINNFDPSILKDMLSRKRDVFRIVLNALKAERCLSLIAEIYSGKDWHNLSEKEKELVKMLEEAGYIIPASQANGFVGKNI